MGAPARRWGMAPGRRRGQRCGGRGGEGALALRLSLKGFWLHPPPPEDSPVPPGHTWADTRVWGIPIPLTCVRCNQESAAFCFAESLSKTPQKIVGFFLLGSQCSVSGRWEGTPLHV